MLYADFTAEEANNKALQKRVTRYTAKLIRGPPHYISAIAPPPILSGITTLTGAKSNNGTATVNTGTKTALHAAPPPLELKYRKTGNQVHASTVNKQMRTQLKKRVNDDAYASAMKKLRYERTNLLIKDRASVVQIVAEVNSLYHTSLSAETVRRHIRSGNENIAPRPGGGRKPSLPPLMDQALVNAVTSFIGLGCAEMQQQPRRKSVIEKLRSCLSVGPCMLKDYESLYKRLYPLFASDIQVVTGHSKIEE